MGAIATGDVVVLDNDVIMAAGITKTTLEEATDLQRLELDRRERLYRGGRPAPELRGRTVILVDDGVATGATAAACAAAFPDAAAVAFAVTAAAAVAAVAAVSAVAAESASTLACADGAAGAAAA